MSSPRRNVPVTALRRGRMSVPAPVAPPPEPPSDAPAEAPAPAPVPAPPPPPPPPVWANAKLHPATRNAAVNNGVALMRNLLWFPLGADAPLQENRRARTWFLPPSVTKTATTQTGTVPYAI